MRRYGWGIIFLCVCFLTGCMYVKASMKLDENMIGKDYEAVDVLLDMVTPPLMLKERVLVASFVNVDNMENTTTFGRTISEHYASRLAQHDIGVVEMKLRKSVFIKEESGEFLLSRDVKELSAAHNAAVVFVGTYSIARYLVYVSARAVSVETNTILASYDYKLPIGENIQEMLREKKKSF